MYSSQPIKSGLCYTANIAPPEEGGKTETVRQISGQFVNMMLDKLEDLKVDLDGAENITGRLKEKGDELNRLRNKKKTELRKLRDARGLIRTDMAIKTKQLREMKTDFEEAENFVKSHPSHTQADPKRLRQEIRELGKECNALMRNRTVSSKLKGDTEQAREVRKCMEELANLMRFTADQGDQNQEPEEFVSDTASNTGPDQEPRYQALKRLLKPKKGIIVILILVIYLLVKAYNFHHEHRRISELGLNRFIGDFLTRESQTIRYGLFVILALCLLRYLLVEVLRYRL